MQDASYRNEDQARSSIARSRPHIWSRSYFALQSLAGVCWWIGVFAVDEIRAATLGDLPAGIIAWFDIPLFAVGSVLVACGLRRAVWIVVPWILIVTFGLLTYSLATRTAGFGALLMMASSVCSILAGTQLLCGRIPTELLLRGPFAFRTAPMQATRSHLWRTIRQLILFWVLFLCIIPAIIIQAEQRLGLAIDFALWTRAFGVCVLILASCLGIWSAVTMSTRGQGTPLPSAMPNHLVISGPYVFVRNPMAVAGILQGMAVGLVSSSWLVVIYAFAGSLLWNWLVRPSEEANLETTFGDEFRAYRSRVSCWLPKIRRRQ
ncbi:isoprenylcysteine carboxylmethyltransferase family protein [Glutamicibacter sp. JL.03c]|uniref:methyltransferase family protein n=1 Tax=Glutamicibacter sp. JL.03c TaxID=2984842 RepID=UPI0021F6A21E|nr:isoprenylcysteine carboxylmethyltransferase family protein [Glutamicibacter sp. JL.03c]UYQ78423.1 isoprenylcysteine carboxylmethyltransferase family protein [Glutamicibacter sp. JL.03c]